MKLLFISSRDTHITYQGAPQCTNRNYESFCELLGKQSVKVENLGFHDNTSIKKKLAKRFSLLYGYYWGLSKIKIKRILDTANDYEAIFIDSSFYGIIAYYLKKRGYKGKIISHFHNAEIILRLEKAKRIPWRFWEIFIIYYNEKMAFKYSDEVVVLNERDKKLLQRIYGKRKVKIIPISMIDTYNKQVHSKEKISNPPVFLFLGGNHFANYHGIRWFIRHVFSQVDMKLLIAGKGMEKLKKKFSKPRLEITGYVPDLSELLINADFIVSPVFKGGGMKVKTCEALMYGKNVIGTKESFEGYEIDPSKAGALCNTKEEFIDVVQNIGEKFQERFNEYSRKCFEEKYSFQATLQKFKELLS